MPTTAAGNVVVVTAGAAKMVIEKSTNVVPLAFVAVTRIGYSPAAVGVPINAVPDRVIPGGRVPVCVTVGSSCPGTAIVTAYSVPTRPEVNDVVAISGAAGV
jgi:hypothetical protein